jgi:hypothetical protein
VAQEPRIDRYTDKKRIKTPRRRGTHPDLRVLVSLEILEKGENVVLGWDAYFQCLSLRIMTPIINTRLHAVLGNTRHGRHPAVAGLLSVGSSVYLPVIFMGTAPKRPRALRRYRQL